MVPRQGRSGLCCFAYLLVFFGEAFFKGGGARGFFGVFRFVEGTNAETEKITTCEDNIIFEEQI